MRAQFSFLIAAIAAAAATPAQAQSARSYVYIGNGGGGQCAAAVLKSRNSDRSIRATINVHQRTLSNAGSSDLNYEAVKTVAPGGSVRLGCTFEQLGPPASTTTWRRFSIAGAEFP